MAGKATGTLASRAKSALGRNGHVPSSTSTGVTTHRVPTKARASTPASPRVSAFAKKKRAVIGGVAQEGVNATKSKSPKTSRTPASAEKTPEATSRTPASAVKTPEAASSPGSSRRTPRESRERLPEATERPSAEKSPRKSPKRSLAAELDAPPTLAAPLLETQPEPEPEPRLESSSDRDPSPSSYEDDFEEDEDAADAPVSETPVGTGGVDITGFGRAFGSPVRARALGAESAEEVDEDGVVDEVESEDYVAVEPASASASSPLAHSPTVSTPSPTSIAGPRTPEKPPSPLPLSARFASATPVVSTTPGPSAAREASPSPAREASPSPPAALVSTPGASVSVPGAVTPGPTPFTASRAARSANPDPFELVMDGGEPSVDVELLSRPGGALHPLVDAKDADDSKVDDSIAAASFAARLAWAASSELTAAHRDLTDVSAGVGFRRTSSRIDASLAVASRAADWIAAVQPSIASLPTVMERWRVRLETQTARASAALESLNTTRADFAAVEAALRAAAASAESTAAEARRDAAATRAEAKAKFAEASATIASLRDVDERLAAAESRVDSERARADAAESRLAELESATRDAAEAEARRLVDAHEALTAESFAALEAELASAKEARRRAEYLAAAAESHERDATAERHARLVADVDANRADADAARRELDAARRELERLRAEMDANDAAAERARERERRERESSERTLETRAVAAEEEARRARSALLAAGEAAATELAAERAAFHRRGREAMEEDASLRKELAVVRAALEGAEAAAAAARAREEDTMAKSVEMLEAREEQIRRAKDLAAAEIRNAAQRREDEMRELKDELARTTRRLKDAQAAAESAAARAEIAVTEERRRRFVAEEDAAAARRSAAAARREMENAGRGARAAARGLTFEEEERGDPMSSKRWATTREDAGERRTTSAPLQPVASARASPERGGGGCGSGGVEHSRDEHDATDARAWTPGLPGMKSPTARAMFVDQLVGNIAML